jgi:hypothetical protein
MVVVKFALEETTPYGDLMASRGLGTLALVTLAMALAVAGLGVMMLAWPDQAGPGPPDLEAGRRFQGALAQLLLRETGLSSRRDPLVLTEAEVNAFLGGHVEVRDPPVWPIRVRIGAEEVELGGATTVGRLLETGLGSRPGPGLPGPIGGRPVWVAARGRIVVHGGRAEFLARAATIGRQRVPVVLLWRLLGGRPLALTWPMPHVVERVDLEPGRLLIHTRQVRPSRGARG